MTENPGLQVEITLKTWDFGNPGLWEHKLWEVRNFRTWDWEYRRGTSDLTNSWLLEHFTFGIQALRTGDSGKTGLRFGVWVLQKWDLKDMDLVESMIIDYASEIIERMRILYAGPLHSMVNHLQSERSDEDRISEVEAAMKATPTIQDSWYTPHELLSIYSQCCCLCLFWFL